MFKWWNGFPLAHKNEENDDGLKNIDKVKDGPVPGCGIGVLAQPIRKNFENPCNSHDNEDFGKEFEAIHEKQFPNFQLSFVKFEISGFAKV